MAIATVDFARMIVDPGVPRAEVTRLTAGMTPAKIAATLASADAGRDPPGDAEDARPQDAVDPGARHQPHRPPAADRRRRRGRRRPRLPRARDDGAGAARRALQRAGTADRQPGRPAGRADAVLGGGGDRARAGHARPDDVRRDGLGVRHRAGVRRRRRHSLVEGVPGLVLRLARTEDALHLRLRSRGADGCQRGQVDALPRGALHRGHTGGRLSGGAERRHRRRQRHRLGARTGCAR